MNDKEIMKMYIRAFDMFGEWCDANTGLWITAVGLIIIFQQFKLLLLVAILSSWAYCQCTSTVKKMEHDEEIEDQIADEEETP